MKKPSDILLSKNEYAARLHTGLLSIPRSDVPIFLLALISIAACVAGLALLGNAEVAGYFYVASLLSGTPVLLRMDWRNVRFPPAVRGYIAPLAGFTLLCVGHLLMGEAKASILDYVARLWIGLVNGFFFFCLFRFDRRVLFGFITIVATAHAGTSIASALAEGIDFSTFSLTGWRVGGMTNPIPFSNMLLTSIGIVAIALAGAIRQVGTLAGFLKLSIVLLVGVGAVALTGTRGTLVATPLLFILLIHLLRHRLGSRAALSATLVCLSAAILFVLILWAAKPWMVEQLLSRPESDSIRKYLQHASWQLFLDAPLTGHGLNSIPSILGGMPTSDNGFDLSEFNHMHNQYLDMLVKTGALGTVLFFGPLVVAAFAGIRRLQNIDEASFACAILWVAGAYSIYGLTNSYFSHANTTLQFGVYLGMLIWLVSTGYPHRDSGAGTTDIYRSSATGEQGP